MLLKTLTHRLVLIGILIAGSLSALWTNYHRTVTPVRQRHSALQAASAIYAAGFDEY